MKTVRGFVAVLLVLWAAQAWAATVLLRVDTQSPFATPLQKLVALPDFLLLSDGTAFYSRPAKELGQLEYYTAQLGQDELDTVVSRLQLDGANDWDDSYEYASLKDLPTTVFTLTAPHLSKTISVYGAAWSAREKQLPDGLSWLYSYVSNYHAGAEKLFMPTHATLLVKKVSLLTRDKAIENLTIKWTPHVDLDKTTGTLGEYKTIDLSGAEAQDAWNALHGVALPTMLAPRVMFSHKKELYQLAIRPQLPGL